MSRHRPRSQVASLLTACLLASVWPASSALAQVREAATSDLRADVASGPDTVIAHPDGSLETRPVNPRSLGQGSWIRFRTLSDPETEREGRVEAAAGGWIEVIETERASSSILRLDELESLKLRGPGMGRSGGAQVGAGIGVVSGLIIGGVVGHRNEPDCTPNSWFCFEGLATIGGAMLGATIGAATGALIGVAVTSDGWVEVPVASIEARTEGMGLAFRLPVR